MKVSFWIVGLLMLLLRSQSTAAQNKKQILGWLRENLKEIKFTNNDPDLRFSVRKTYIFNEDYFVVKTEKYHADKSLDLPAGFAKIWYKNIIDTSAQGYQQQPRKDLRVFTIWANPGYFILGHLGAPLKYWSTFQGATGVDLYLPGNKATSDTIISKLIKLRDLTLP